MPQRQITLRRATVDDVPALLSLMDSVLAWLIARGCTEQ
jgi:hypothetical protein